MKNIFKFLVCGLVAVMLFSCEKDEDQAIASLKSNANLSADKTSIVLTKPNATQNAIKYSWSNPDYGVNLAITNQLQFAVQGTNFATPKTIDLAAGTKQISYTVEELNAILLGLALTPDVASNVQIRLKSTLGTSVTYSNIINLTATPYALISYMYAPGAYQGWNPPTANTLVSANSNGIYIGFINFTAGNLAFKITPQTNWNNSYGTNSQFNSSTNTIPVIYNGGGDIVAPGIGYYQATIDTNANTLKMIPYQMSLIGSATPGGNWSTDIDMVWDNTLLKWKATATFLSGEFKFRLNHDWNQTNWGGSGGVASTSGANIAITAGVHTVLFDPYNLNYSIQ
ncbi:SusE domain-containing protein [Chryseobacterium taeanense]|uniref:SusE domain-containing protein n=1 Tax=Chryseobacterium taeanense TaxID=311334 RepID=UPI0035B0049D